MRRRVGFRGAIDNQHVLPDDGVEDVLAEMKQRTEDLGLDGGLVLGTVNSIQPDVRLQNVLAMTKRAHLRPIARRGDRQTPNTR
jgi:hypothetical protein